MRLDELIDRLGPRAAPKRNGNGWMVRCPAHEDRNGSLSIGEGKDGRILLHCHAGCTVEAVCEAKGIKLADLMPDGDRKPAKRIVATYPYTDEGGKLLFEVVRFEPKNFLPRHPDASGKDGWVWNMEGVRWVLYRLHELVSEVFAEREIYVAEGEKDADALRAHGFAATCNPFGASKSKDKPKWRDSYSESLRGAPCVVIADKDQAGRTHAGAVARSLHGVAASVKVLELPDVDDKPVKDAFDYFAAGGEAMDLEELAHAAPFWTPKTQLATAALPRSPTRTEGHSVSAIDLGVFSREIGAPEAEAAPPSPLPAIRPWLDIEPPPQSDVLIGPGRWLSRGAGLFIIAPSGAGKSTWSATQAFAWGAGRESLGFVPTKPLRSLIVQAEDDDGDLADMRNGIIGALRLTAAERELVRQNVLIVTERSATGIPFLFDVFEPLLRKMHPDLAWINPLSAYFGDNLNDQQAVAGFFRNNLNRMIAKHECAVIPVHHVPKPSKERGDWTGNQLSYSGAGSADLSNWSRETIVLRETAPGLYDMTCTKRWRKLGWTDLDAKPTGTRRIAYGAGGEQYWRDATPDVLAELGARPYTDAALLELVPAAGIDKAELSRLVVQTFTIAERTARCYVTDATRIKNRRLNGERQKVALLKETTRPRREVYPDAPQGRPVVWLNKL